MLEMVVFSLIVVVIILVFAVFSSFMFIAREQSRQQGLLEKIFQEPKNLKKLGEGIYYGFSQSIKGTKGQYNKKAIAFKRGMIESIIPPEVIDILPEQLRESVRNEPMLITEGLKVISAFKTGGLQGVLQSILKQLGTQVQDNPLLKATGLLPTEEQEQESQTQLSDEHKALIEQYEVEKAKAKTDKDSEQPNGN